MATRVAQSVPDAAVIADADTGYGNPCNVVRTVELWEHTGATGMFLEDQVWPKRCGRMARDLGVDAEVVEAPEAVAELEVLAATHAALQVAYARLNDEGSLRAHLDDLCAFDDFTALVGLDEQRQLAARYGP